MKKLLLSIAVLALVCGTADAQSLLQRLGDKAKEAAEMSLKLNSSLVDYNDPTITHWMA